MTSRIGLLVAATVLFVLAVLCYFYAFDEDGTEASIEEPDREPREFRIEDRVGTPTATAGESPRIERKTVASDAAATDSGGLWLEGSVQTPAGGAGRVQLRIETKGPQGLRKLIRDTADPGGGFSTPLMELIDGGGRSSVILRGTLSHPEHLDESFSIVIESHSRKAAMSGQRVVVPIDLSLTPASRVVAGTVRVPDGFSVTRVRVVMLQPIRKSALPELVDETRPRRDGAFVLRGRAGERAYVVAWLRTESSPPRILRPTTVHLAQWRGDRGSISIEVKEGSELAGRVLADGQLREIGLRMAARLDSSSLPDGEPPLSLPEEEDEEEFEVVDVHRDAIESESQPKPSWQKPPRVIRGPRRFVELMFAGGSFEYFDVPVLVDREGRFRTRGLRFGARYEFRDMALLFNGQTVASWPGPQRELGSATTPNDNVQLRFPFHLIMLRAKSGGRPIARKTLLIEPSKESTRTDDNGHAVFATEEDRNLTVSVICRGFVRRAAKVRPNQWTDVVLEPERAR